MKSLEEDEILTDEQLQGLLKVSRTTLWRLRRDRGLPFGRVGRTYRYRKSEVLAWMREFGDGTLAAAQDPAIAANLQSDHDVDPRGSDIFSPARRSEIMASVPSRDTAPELAVRRALHRLGFRFRLHAANLPGKPDVVIPKLHCALFVHGCFWHQHAGCARSKLPKTRADWWQAKLQGNVEHDSAVQRQLRELGWNVQVVWECQTERSASLESAFRELGIDQQHSCRQESSIESEKEFPVE